MRNNVSLVLKLKEDNYRNGKIAIFRRFQQHHSGLTTVLRDLETAKK